MHLYAPSGSAANFGESGRGGARPWAATWLCGAHGNPGIKAVGGGAKQDKASSYFKDAGHLMYYNPHAAGDGKPDSLDYAVPAGIIASVRSSWEKDALFLAVKGGDNRDQFAQLDIGSFVLEAGGKRFGQELGMESDKAPGLTDRAKRFDLYVNATAGQSTLSIGGENQDKDARSALLLSQSTPELGLAVIDMSKAYSKGAKDAFRGIMAVRSAEPYLVLQDDISIKNSKTLTWSMQTKSEVAPDGSTAVLTEGGKKMLASIVSPAGATFSIGEPPEKANEQSRDLIKEGVRILKVEIPDAKGPVSICVTFTTAEKAPAHTHKPIAEWVKKK
jgi:hypothetical protein